MDKQQRILYIVLGVAVLLLSFRFLVFARFFLLFFLIVASVGFLVYLAYYYWQAKKEERAFTGSVEGRIVQQLSECQELFKKNKLELNEIEQSVKELKESRAKTGTLTVSNQKTSDKLLRAFEEEKKIRETKAAFFATAKEKLENLLHNHHLEQELKEKEQKLLEMREDQFEELAKLEELKYNLETDTYYLEAIDELSQKMLESRTVASASTLKLELEKMTEQLNRLRP